MNVLIVAIASDQGVAGVVRTPNIVVGPTEGQHEVVFPTHLILEGLSIFVSFNG